MDTIKLPDYLDALKQQLVFQETSLRCLLGIESMLEIFLANKPTEHTDAHIHEHFCVAIGLVEQAKKLNQDATNKLNQIIQ
jgi:hypothetical protein